jgi:hypothetical protein
VSKDDDEAVARQVEADVLQVVRARAADADAVVRAQRVRADSRERNKLALRMR